MAKEKSENLGRRALIGGAAGGVAALALGGLGSPRGTRAATGNPVLLGLDNSQGSGTGTWIRYPDSQPDVATQSMLATFTTGVFGSTRVADGEGLWGFAYPSSTGGVGVRAKAEGTNGKAVYGETTGHFSQVVVDANGTVGAGEGIAVRGRTKNGIALYGEAQGSGGYGLQVIGRAVFNRSGKTTISVGSSSKTISGHVMTAATLVVATVQGNPTGVWVRNVSVSDANDTFTIRLNKAAPSGGVVVGYFVVN
jgi:hypothetical protein